MIRVEHVTKKFYTKDGEVVALEDISFDLPNKGFVALCGENGCGKTTILNLIATLMSDYEGKIFIDNLDVANNSDFVRSKLVSYVLQDEYFIDSINVIDTLFLEDADYNKIRSELDLFKISDKALKKPCQLSGGQRQRVSFLRGVLKEGDILLVDEPTSSMDEEMERFVFEKLKELSKTKLIVLVSHNLSMVQEYSDLIITLNNGTVQSVVNNSLSADISYEKNEILFPGDLNFKAIDKVKASKMLEAFGYLVIKRKEKQSDVFNGDYLPRVHNNTNVRKKLKSSQSKIAFKSMMLDSIKILVSLAVVLGILLVLLEAMVDLKSFDAAGFVFNSIKNNDEFLVSTAPNPYLSENKEMTINDVYDLKRQSGSRIDIVSTWETPKEIECEYDDFYMNLIHGISRTYLTEAEMLKGDVPQKGQFAITDYIADSLIRKNNKYSTYEDIISKGILLDDYLLDVCGIVDTDYEYYLNLGEEWDKKDVENFSINQMKIYTIIFCNEEIKLASKIGLRYVLSGDCFADVILDDKLNDSCAINSVLAENLGYDGTRAIEYKTDFGYIEVDSILEDGLENPTIYVGKTEYQTIADTIENTFNYINIEVINKDTISFLMLKDVMIDSYTGNYVYSILHYIKLLDDFFFVLSALVFASLLVLMFFYLKKISNNNIKMYVFQRISGYQHRYFFRLEISMIVIGILFMLLLNFGAYYLLYFLMNFALSKSFDLSICVMMNSFTTFILIAVGAFVISLLLELINYFVRSKKQIVDLL